MDIRAEILDYISRKELTGALLLTGQWGCGKSYLVKEIAKELNENKAAAIAVVSLFGLDSISAINKRVKDEYTGFLLGTLGNKAKRVSKALATIAKDGMAVASVATDGIPGLSAASQGLSSVMTYDLFGFIDVKKTIGKDEKEREFIIAFDDLERSNIPKKDLLGAINEYVENKHIKVIIIADQEKINGNEYKEYKEKLISRTIRMSADYNALIDCIIRGYSETSEGYKEFLTQNSDLLKQVFKESKSQNLRTFKVVLADFERIYEAWIEVGVPTDNMKWALYTFASEVFISRSPKNGEAAQDKKKQSVPFEKNEEQYVDRGKKRSYFSSFRYWISDGVWDNDLFVKELKERYSEEEDTPLDRLLYYSFWTLQQKDIDDGLPTAITLAYEGKLSRETLIYLLTKIHSLRMYSISLPCIIDYEKIEVGLKWRIDAVKKGKVKEAKNRTFATKDQLDPEAISVYNLITRFEDIIDVWRNREKFVDYLEGETDKSRSILKGLYIEELDDELLTLFEKTYYKACNNDKTEYANALLSLVFDFSTYFSEENITKTQQNFKRLIEWLEMLPTDDAITTIINKSFIKHIQDSEIMNREK